MDLATGCWSLNFLPEKLLSVSRIARQVNEAECSGVLAKVLGSPSFAQKYINTVSRCGSLGRAQAIISKEQCRPCSAGIYCLSVDIGRITSSCK